ncbi:DUF4476 domain-containing protein [uncultured Microscilla sp.]|uniref:DUF4476 domain-containing protein n=1 Tax=uncultured Microscilla sp. TaxID=432653 RepID=UPI0026196747|nr:DUF4476 domain-containing protein [uncultured Microscilla sp.]
MKHLIKTGFLALALLACIEAVGLGQLVYAQKCVKPLSEATFNTYKQQLQQESFEEDRMTMATSFIKQKQCIKVSQIKTVIQLFNFEDNKLEFAKLAYNYVHDPENYREIVSLFTYSSTRKTLARYINKRK